MIGSLYSRIVAGEDVRRLTADEQRAIMAEWFRIHYENPARRTEYESGDSGDIWISGGPYDAGSVLREEFDGIFPDDVIRALSVELSDECPEWVPIRSESEYGYDEGFLDVVRGNSDPRRTLGEAIETVERLLILPCDESLAPSLHRLLLANVITSLETYLSDTFINRVLNDYGVLRAFVESTPDFRGRTLAYSEIFKAVSESRDEAKRHLLDVVWHNIGKVKAMYRDTLGVEMREGLVAVAKAIPLRHDIVHRNGRDRDGNAVLVSQQDVVALIDDVLALASDVEEQLKGDF